MRLKYNHEVYLYDEGYLEDLYYRFPELKDTFLVADEIAHCLVDIKTGYCYVKLMPDVNSICYNYRDWWIRSDLVKDTEQYKDALKALNKILYKQETTDKMSELLCTTLLAVCYMFSTVMLMKFIDLMNISVGLFALHLLLILLVSVLIGLLVYTIFYECVKYTDINFAKIMNEYIKPV